MLKFQIMFCILFSLKEFVLYKCVIFCLTLQCSIFYGCNNGRSLSSGHASSLKLSFNAFIISSILCGASPSLVSPLYCLIDHILCSLAVISLWMLRFSLVACGPSTLPRCSGHSFRPGATWGLVLSPSLSLAYLFSRLLK